MHFALDSDPRIAVARRASSAGPEVEAGAGPFLDAFEAAARRFRDRTALRIRTAEGWTELTYGAIRAEARRVASWLVEQGVAKGTTVALVSESRPEWVVAMLGVMESGATLVPIDSKLTAPEIAMLLGHSQPRFVLASQAQHAKVQSVAAGVISVESVLTLDASAGAPLPALRPRKLRAARRRESHEVALVVYTSGTTGNPKGVEITFGNLLFEARAMDIAIGPAGSERFLSVLPLNHLYELICGLLTPLHRGATISYSDSLLPDDVVALLRGEGVTSVVGVPLLFLALKRGIERNVKARGADAQKRFDRAMRIARWVPGMAARRALFAPVLEVFAPSLRACYSGGAALDPEVAQFFSRMGIPIYQGYGLSEASPVIATNTPRANRVGSVGRPLEGVEVRIVRKEPSDVVGEIQTRGDHVMAGYRGQPMTTRDVLDADGWLATGDLGYVDVDGYLWVTGRSKDLIVLGGGKKVHPDEVEEALARSPLFQEVCVVGVPATTGMAAGFDEVCAVIVPGSQLVAHAAGDAAALDAATEEEIARVAVGLASFKRPTRVVLRGEPLPRTATRKLQRPHVRAWLALETIDDSTRPMTLDPRKARSPS